MKLIAIKPIYHNSNVVVEQETFETNEQHGRELVTKGYAVEVQVNLPSSGLVPGGEENNLPEPEPEPEPEPKTKKK